MHFAGGNLGQSSGAMTPQRRQVHRRRGVPPYDWEHGLVEERDAQQDGAHAGGARAEREQLGLGILF
jgi:hypothetical protein